MRIWADDLEAGLIARHDMGGGNFDNFPSVALASAASLTMPGPGWRRGIPL